MLSKIKHIYIHVAWFEKIAYRNFGISIFQFLKYKTILIFIRRRQASESTFEMP